MRLNVTSKVLSDDSTKVLSDDASADTKRITTSDSAVSFTLITILDNLSCR